MFVLMLKYLCISLILAVLKFFPANEDQSTENG